MRVGFIGTGAITKAIVEGLDRAGKDNTILVSNRSEAVSRDIERRFARIKRAPNAEVAANSDIVFIATRPTQVEEALAGISFHRSQIVISFVTGLSVQDLAKLAPLSTVGRVLPLPSIARCEGPIICYPGIPEILQLFEGMGHLVVPESESELLAMGSVSGFMSTYFELQNSLIAWLGRRGVTDENASTYVRAMLFALSSTAYSTSETEMDNLPAEHETKGGLNQRVRQKLKDRSWFDQPAECFGEILSLKRSSLE
ncbi:NAD(P)-binding domain-containing protein [Borborobacter arsenicus]|nr:NAD(P)-binding domain-containing protein [Pseudaminobacter arsenicus]